MTSDSSKRWQSRSAIWTTAFTTALALCGTASHAADAYPNKPIRLIVPFEAGGTSDTTARMVAQQLEKRLGVQLIIDNRAGANGAIGAAAVAHAPPDGYTLLHTTPAFIINPYVNKTLTYDVFKDFVPITNVGIGTGYILVVNARLPVRNVKELVAYGTANHKGLTFSSPGIGNALHLASEMFAAKINVPVLHVPYKGTAGALSAVAAGDVDFMIMPPTVAAPFVQTGKVRAIAVTSATRLPEYPSSPTMKESGIDDLVIAGTWLGWFAPAGTPKPVIDKLATEIRAALATPEVEAAFATAGFKVDGRPPAEFAAFVRSESQRFGEVLKRVKLE